MKAKRLGLLGAVLVGSFLSTGWAQVELCNEAGTLTRNADGSFYYSSDLRYGQDLADLNSWMQRLNEVLAADGTLLVAVPTPLRGMANGEVVTDTATLKALGIDFSAAEARAYYRDYVASLEPIVAVDLLDAAQTFNGKTIGYHQKFDRHWTPEGARASAQAVCSGAARKPCLSGSDPV